MNEELRTLLYPLGFIAQIAFGARFIIQWIASEKVQRSVTPKLFWHLSIFANFLLYVHSLIQLHFPMSLAQSQNFVLSMRNLQLLGSQKKRPLFFVIFSLLFAMAVTVLFFVNSQAASWIATPNSMHIPPGVHLFGIMGIGAFGLRFWVQWWQAEQRNEGNLTESFWWISLVGAIVCTIYFCVIQDWVNFIGPFVSLIPYSRNLYFLRRA